MSQFRLTRKMSITHREFFRLLPRAVDNAPVSRQNGRVIVYANEGRVAIFLAAETLRKLAMLELPVTEITLEFTDFTDAAREAFLARFDLAFQKGGG